MLRFFVVMYLCVIFICSISYADRHIESTFIGELVKKSDVILIGTILDLSKTNDYITYTVEVDQNIDGKLNNQKFEFQSALTNGFFKEDQFYPQMGEQYVLFLTSENGFWKVTQGDLGAFHKDSKEDIKLLSGLLKKTKDNKLKNELKATFSQLKSIRIRSLLLDEISDMINQDDIAFLDQIFQSRNKQEKVYALKNYGKLKISNKKSQIINILKNSNDNELISVGLSSLGKITNQKEIDIVLPFLTHKDQAVRRTAIEYCQKNGSSKVSSILREIYSEEKDDLNRLAIINTIISITKNPKELKEILRYFRELETVGFLQTKINNNL